MTVDLSITQGTTSPTLYLTITDQNGNPINLASAKFLMRDIAYQTPHVDAAMTIVSAPAGTVSYAWSTTDTAYVGLFMGQVLWTDTSGNTGAYPNSGYLTIEVQENLLTDTEQQIITLGVAKDLLNIGSQDHSHDTKIMRFIRAWTPVIEFHAGPIIQATYEEWHPGGSTSITLKRRPSTSYGTTPVLFLNACSEYNGPIEWELAIISSPDQGQTYSCQLDANYGQVVRRTAGGGVAPFATSANMPQSVHVWYTAGQQTVPGNVQEAMGVLLQLHYQKTQQGAPAGWGGRDASTGEPTGSPIGFALPGKVRELLLPNRRAPSFA
jgi:hypothetical protein